MGWKKTARSFGVPTTARGVLQKSVSASRQLERDALRRQREHERKQKELEKMQEVERAAYEVEEHENYLNELITIHKESGKSWDWQKIKSSTPPTEPQASDSHERNAKEAMDNFTPSFLDKKFKKRLEKKKNNLLRKIDEAKETDKTEYQNAHQEYVNKYEEWSILNNMAEKISVGDFEVYPEVLTYVNPFEKISDYGSGIKIQTVNKEFIVADINVREKDIVPIETKSLLKSGKLSVKQMPNTKFYEIYQNFVSGLSLRIARETFAVLPVEKIIVNTSCKMLNTKTGHMENLAILSMLIPKRTLEDLNLENISPIDSLENFVHKIDFKKNQGFNPIETLNPSEY